MPITAKAGKRKRASDDKAFAKRQKSASDDEDDQRSQVSLLEAQISKSRLHWNNIPTLIDLARQDDKTVVLAAARALCRTYIRLLAKGDLRKRTNMSDKESVRLNWLRDRFDEVRRVLISMLEKDNAFEALAMLMALLKPEASYMDGSGRFPRTSFAQICGAIFETSLGQVRREFAEKFVTEYHDVRFFTFEAVKGYLTEEPPDTILSNIFDLLMVASEKVPRSNEEIERFFIDSAQQKHTLHLPQLKKRAQAAWLAMMTISLSKKQRKELLEVMDTSIAPWFTKPEHLLDFLTDCYDSTDGEIRIRALSGIYYLWRERNLDYPLFYTKLYSLLDPEILHSKYRSRFIRLLELFLSSSHLPAALVASFIKRLSRLALNAPAAGIVPLVPFFYNLFKRHPLTTFMIHRTPRTQQEKDRLENEGFEDPFLPDEQDPMHTRAIDSCIWEIVQLQSHWHPNVATIAKIVSEQFTKQAYRLEDFLDHSYGTLLDAEISKEVKKPPVVEFIIPKRIFTHAEAGAEESGGVLATLWDFGTG